MINVEQRVEIKSRLTGDVLLTVDSEDLSGANLSGADLRWASLRDANLRDADLSGADLRWASLRDANLRDANLRDANLRGAILSDADLSGANLSGADLSYAVLRDAELSDADLSRAVGNGREVITLQLGRYHVVVAGERMAIGCCTRNIADWLALNETDIEQLDGNDAVEWAATWRPVIEAFLTAREKEAANAE